MALTRTATQSGLRVPTRGYPASVCPQPERRRRAVATGKASFVGRTVVSGSAVREAMNVLGTDVVAIVPPTPPGLPSSAPPIT